MTDNTLIRDSGMRYALTLLALTGDTHHVDVAHIELGALCTASPFCCCKPQLVRESRVDGSEVWEHWGE